VIFSSAAEAFTSAFFVWLLGGAALSIAGQFAGEMIPSLPPFLAARQPLESGNPAHHFAVWESVRSGFFVLLFAIFFVHSMWKGLRGGGEEVGRRVQGILSKLRENWFSLIVTNAIGAWVATLMLSILPSVGNFALAQMFWHSIGGWVASVISGPARFILGPSNTDAVSAWILWYGDNHLKLNFWIIYLGSAFDDLGVPNFKTLARWAWRRWRQRKRACFPVAVGPSGGAET
jgi:hypothetical protein